MLINNNMFYINKSSKPMLMTMNLFNLILSNIFFFNFNYKFNFYLILLMLIMWNNNNNNKKFIFNYKMYLTNLSFKMMMLMFIMSELLFFLTLFYMYFSNKLFNLINFKKISFNMYKLNFILSLINLIILISSSLSLMIYIKMNNKKNSFNLITIILSLYFIIIQMIEFYYLNYNIMNFMFNMFYLLTSFHLIHVLMGMTMMLINFVNKFQFMNILSNKIIYICWYWHFIDLIWILIFFVIY